MPSGALLTRRAFFILLAPVSGAAFASSEAGEMLDVRLERDRLKVTAPRFHFVVGKSLQRLHDGAPVPFAVQLSVSLDRAGSPLLRDIQRFVISYDLWEQKFSITRLGPGRNTTLQATAEAAEAWCIEEMGLEAGAIRDDQLFWVKLEVRAEDPGSRVASDSDPVSLARLIDLFGRRSRGDDKRWEVQAGPFRLAEIKRSGRKIGQALAPLRPSGSLL